MDNFKSFVTNLKMNKEKKMPLPQVYASKLIESPLNKPLNPS